jgi:hypothetical protein
VTRNDRPTPAPPAADAAPERTALDPWVAGAQVGRQLGAWATLSVVAGALLLLASDDVAARAGAERRRLRRLLRLNAVLDVGYVAVGVGLLLAWRTEAGVGHGWGVVVQGGFLLVFDAVHAWRLRDPAA